MPPKPDPAAEAEVRPGGASLCYYLLFFVIWRHGAHVTRYFGAQKSFSGVLGALSAKINSK